MRYGILFMFITMSGVSITRTLTQCLFNRLIFFLFFFKAGHCHTDIIGVLALSEKSLSSIPGIR